LSAFNDFAVRTSPTTNALPSLSLSLTVVRES